MRVEKTGKPYLLKSRMPDLIKAREEAPKRAVAERLRSIRQGAVDSGRLPATGQQMRTNPISQRKDAQVPKSIRPGVAKRVASRNMMKGDPGYRTEVHARRAVRGLEKSLARRGTFSTNRTESESIRDKVVRRKNATLARNVSNMRRAPVEKMSEAAINKEMKLTAKGLAGAGAGRRFQRVQSHLAAGNKARAGTEVKFWQEVARRGGAGAEEAAGKLAKLAGNYNPTAARVSDRLQRIKQGGVVPGSKSSDPSGAKIPSSISKRAAGRVQARNTVRSMRPEVHMVTKANRTARGMAKSMARRGIDPSKGLTGAIIPGKYREFQGPAEHAGTAVARGRLATKMGKLARNVKGLREGRPLPGKSNDLQKLSARAVAATNKDTKLLSKISAKTGSYAQQVMQRAKNSRAALGKIASKLPKMPGTGVLDFVSKESVDQTMKKIEDMGTPKALRGRTSRNGA